MAASTPTMVTGYTNQSIADSLTTTIAEGDGATGFTHNGHIAWHLTRVLLLCGGTCTGSSTRTSGTGTSANAMTATDQWALGSYTAAYAGAWWACSITIGGIQRNYVIQVNGAGNLGVRIKVSYGAGSEFTNSGGSVTAVRTKAVTGEGYVTGGGTDASPTFATMPFGGTTYYVSAWWDVATGYLGYSWHPTAGGTAASAGFVFAILPIDANTVLSTRDTHVTLCSPTYLLTASSFTEASTDTRATYQCRRGITSTAFAAVKPQYRVALGATSTDPGTGDKIDSLVSWKRDASPVDTGGLTPDMIALGQTTSVPRMRDVRINPNSATVRRYLCLGELALRVPNSFVSN